MLIGGSFNRSVAKTTKKACMEDTLKNRSPIMQIRVKLDDTESAKFCVYLTGQLRFENDLIFFPISEFGQHSPVKMNR